MHKGSPAFIVDAGPSATAPQLLAALEDLDIRHLDYILITHIHIDHAGAVAELSRAYPDAAIVCHPAGIPHLEDPVRLWEGSVKTLGDVGKAYGPLQPVPGGRMVDADGFTAEEGDCDDLDQGELGRRVVAIAIVEVVLREVHGVEGAEQSDATRGLPVDIALELAGLTPVVVEVVAAPALDSR